MTTGCPGRLGDLGAYALGGLDPDEVEALEAHLAVCTGCTAELGEIEPLLDLLALADPASHPAPADLRPRTLAGMRPPRRRRLPVVAALVVITALGGATVIALEDRNHDPPVALTLTSDAEERVTGDVGLEQTPWGVQMELVLDGLQPAGQGYYHAWLARGGYRVSAGTFVGGPDGRAVARLQCGGQLDDYDALLVTWHGRGRDDEVVTIQRSLSG